MKLVAANDIVSGAVPVWPDLTNIGLSDREVLHRRSGVGGSDANVILSGDPERLMKLWREKRGEAQPDDLSRVLPVMLGNWTEAFNRHWYQQEAGLEVVRVGEAVQCRTNEWRRCTLDGFVPAKAAIWEAKHTNAFANEAEVLERYMPQLQHNMAVDGCQYAVLSVIFGNHKWACFDVAADWLYQEELLDREAQFWHCVQNGIAPVAEAPPPAPKAVAVREICLDGNNMWSAAAADWLDNREAAKTHASAATTLRSLVQDDVSRAYGHGLELKRSKSGALMIRELAL